MVIKQLATLDGYVPDFNIMARPKTGEGKPSRRIVASEGLLVLAVYVDSRVLLYWQLIQAPTRGSQNKKKQGDA